MTAGGTAGSAPADTRLETGGVLTPREAATAQDVGDDGASGGTGHGRGMAVAAGSPVPTGSTPAPVPMTLRARSCATVAAGARTAGADG